TIQIPPAPSSKNTLPLRTPNRNEPRPTNQVCTNTQQKRHRRPNQRRNQENVGTPTTTRTKLLPTPRRIKQKRRTNAKDRPRISTQRTSRIQKRGNKKTPRISTEQNPQTIRVHRIRKRTKSTDNT